MELSVKENFWQRVRGCAGASTKNRDFFHQEKGASGRYGVQNAREKIEALNNDSAT